MEQTSTTNKKFQPLTSFAVRTAAQRPQLVAKFQEEDAIRVAVLSITAAGTGLTLTVPLSGGEAEMLWPMVFMVFFCGEVVGKWEVSEKNNKHDGDLFWGKKV